MLASPPPIHDQSGKRESPCTDLCGVRSAIVVPTATTIPAPCGSSFEVGGHLAVKLACRTLP